MEEENTNYPIEFPAEPQPGAPINWIALVALVLAVVGVGFGGFVFYKTSLLEKGQKSLAEEIKSVSELVSAIENANQEQPGQSEQSEQLEQKDRFNSGEVGSEIQEQAPITEEDTASSRDRARKQDLKAIAAGLEKYKAVNKSYPISQGLEKLNNPESKTYKALVVGGHLASMPKDPLDSDGRFYGYKSSTDGKSYQLTASLENTTDPEGKASGSLWLYFLSNIYNQYEAQPSSLNSSGGPNLSNLSNGSNETSASDLTNSDNDFVGEPEENVPDEEIIGGEIPEE